MIRCQPFFIALAPVYRPLETQSLVNISTIMNRIYH